MKKLILFLTLIAATVTTYAQQWDSLPRLITGTDTAEYIYRITGIGSSLYYCSDKGLFSSTDNGDSWTNLTYTKTNTAGKAIRCIYYDSTTTALYAGGDTAIFRSTDNGSTWTTRYTFNDRVNDLTRIGTRLLAAYGAFGHGGVALSTDGFATTTQATDTFPKDFFYIDANNTFVAGAKGVYRSTDNGSTWTLAGTGWPANCRFYSLVERAGVYYAGDVYGNGLFISADNGATWSNRDSSVFHPFCQVFSTVQTGGRIVLSVDGACNGGEPLKTSTDGTTWSSYLGNLGPAYYSILGLNTSGSCIFTFYRNQRTPYRSCGTTGISDIATTTATLTPNPAHTQLTIRTAEAKAATIRIISLSGQQLAETTTTNGTAQLYISDLAAGIYIAHITSAAGSQTLKFVKE